MLPVLQASQVLRPTLESLKSQFGLFWLYHLFPHESAGTDRGQWAQPILAEGMLWQSYIALYPPHSLFNTQVLTTENAPGTVLSTGYVLKLHEANTVAAYIEVTF